MAGTVHEVENHARLAGGESEAANAAQELVEAARLHRGQIVVIGCSTSEVVGHQVGAFLHAFLGLLHLADLLKRSVVFLRSVFHSQITIDVHL